MSDDLSFDRELTAWLLSSPARPRPEVVDRALKLTQATRQRTGLSLAVLGPSPWPTTVRGLRRPWPSLRVALFGALTILALGATTIGGGALLDTIRPAPPGQSPTPTATQRATPAGVSDSLIVLVPQGAWSYDRIRALRPDGQIVGVVSGSTNGCNRHVLAADGSRVAYTYQGPPLVIAPLDGSPRLTVNPARFLGGAFSPDRTRYAYLDGTSDRADLTIVSLADGTATMVAQDLNGVALDWSADDILAIGVKNETEIGIDLIAADGTNHRRLVRMPREGSTVEGLALSWSPDGSRLAYGPFDGPSDPQETWLVDAVTGRATLVATVDGQPVAAWSVVANSLVFVWSPDGRDVAYGSMLLDLETGHSRPMPKWSYQPQWSPDGFRLAILSEDTTSLTTMLADLSEPVAQSVEGGAMGLFAWSPDGRQIAVLSASSLYLLDAAGIEPPIRILDDVPPGGHCLTWSEFETP
jgi:Tol biopolymer transport system component